MQNNKSLRNLVALSLLPGFGPKRVKQLLLKFPDASRIFKLSKTELRSVEGIGEASALTFLSFNDWDEVDKIILKTGELNAHILTLADEEYPDLLKQIYDPPVLLWYKGNVDMLNEPGVAIVGTRNTTAYGRKMARKVSKELSESGLCIFSGLAHGIDAIAHRAAVDTNGKTVAVLGSGIDWVYPSENRNLANDIVQSNGIVITEYPPGTKPDAGNFPVRNRIVSGLSYGTLVIESGIQGGSIITAELALDQSREVFAVPHSIENPSGTGCNYLIKTGAAKLVQTVDDVLEELPVGKNIGHRRSNLEEPARNSWRQHEMDDLSTKICSFLEQKEYQIDELSDVLEVSTSQLLVTMLTLEMKEIVLQKAGKVFGLK
ncbi:MAG: DNA-protecting protein DprA [Cyanothece sp. SIO1E1]|nr:DNA-protecting protein DprA [Cyanothece sp. SIO1E1]